MITFELVLALLSSYRVRLKSNQTIIRTKTSLADCPICGKPIVGSKKFCDRICLKEGYKRGLVVNSGNFKPGSVSLNKGRTLESWVGPERAAEIRSRMSLNSKKKAAQLKKLNEDKDVLARRLISRKFHDEVVLWIASSLRGSGNRVFILSEYVKEKRIPDAIVFDGKRLIAVEVETEKRWKPSHAATDDRLARLNKLCGFFDDTRVVFPRPGDDVPLIGPDFVSAIMAEERLNPIQ